MLNKPVVGMASTPDGKGYWLVAADGGVFSFGDAHFYGSTGGITLNAPIVGMASHANGAVTGSPRPTGASSPSGTRRFYGSLGNIPQAPPDRGHDRRPPTAGVTGSPTATGR